MVERAKALGETLRSAPRAYDLAASARMKDHLGARWATFSPDEAHLLEGIGGCSPYLKRQIQSVPDILPEIFRTPFQEYQDGLLKEVAGIRDADDPARHLRTIKQKAALSIALADIGSAIDTMTATRALSEFADAVIDAGLRSAARQRGYDESLAGLAVIAMGKLGAHELNYSSDIDLVIVFDATRMAPGTKNDAREMSIRLARDLVAILQNQTADGYVFRTDLRLRPDPGVSPLALSVEAAELYYEAHGQNWERMAYIKARPAAGDIATGDAFLSALRPFVWRKYLDFAAIEDVKAVKRQIHSAKGGGDIEFAGHNLKTGRGGIREIEFYAQTQQLILGGKNRDLRLRSTLESLAVLCQHGHINAGERDELTAAYRHLRHVEHRLQMINDEQTHAIPTKDVDIERAAIFSGAATIEEFRDGLVADMKCVQFHFDALFRTDVDDFLQPGPLVFTGVDNDPETVKTLTTLGFKRTEDVSAIIRRWHTGSIRATRTERARHILTKLMPALLDALSRSGDPDASFVAFDRFLSQLPAGVQIFSLLENNVGLFDTLIEIVTVSPFLGNEMSRRPNFIESLLENGLASSMPGLDGYEKDLSDTLESAENYEDILNLTRRWVGEAKFFVAAKLAVGVISADIAATYLSAIAHAAIGAITPATIGEMERQHGKIDGELCVLGLGRLGAGEMTLASDIDLMFIYNASPQAQSAGDKTGARALGGTEYFTRLVRRLVTALSVATEEGALYEVDMALRPSGGAGPAAVSLAAFQRYYRGDAWTWEIMALTRAQVMTATGGLGSIVSDEIDAIITRQRDPKATARDVDEMRQRLLEAKGKDDPWDVKNVLGGLTDVAFLVQWAVLSYAAQFGAQPANTALALTSLRDAGVLSPDDVQALLHARHVYEAVLQASRAATGGVFRRDGAGAALSSRMATVCGADDVEAAEALLRGLQEQVASLYRQVLGLNLKGIG